MVPMAFQYNFFLICPFFLTGCHFIVHLFQLDISGRRNCEARQGNETVETRPLPKEIRIFESPRPSPQALCAEALPRVHIQRPQRIEKVGKNLTL